MVAPVTTSTTSMSWPGYYPGWPDGSNPGVPLRMAATVTKTRRRQKRPFNLVLPYDSRAYRVLRPSGNGSFDSSNNFGTYHDATKAFDQVTLDQMGLIEFARRQARERFSGKLNEAASLAVTLAERKQAMDMIEKRVTSIYRTLKAAKRGDFRLAAYELQLAGSPQPFQEVNRMMKEGRLRAKSRYLANNYLEFHFGWSPLIKDIQSGLKLLDSPIPFGPIVGRGSYFTKKKIFSGQNGSFGSVDADHEIRIRVSCGADVYVTNPNLFLASRMGLINPLTVLMELTPWSFVADWFVNLSDYLNQFTEFAGMTISGQYTSVKTSDVSSWYFHNGNTSAKVVDLGVNTYEHFSRSDTLPGIKLGLRKPWRLSARRAAAMCALLVQLMPKRA